MAGIAHGHEGAAGGTAGRDAVLAEEACEARDAEGVTAGKAAGGVARLGKEVEADLAARPGICLVSHAAI